MRRAGDDDETRACVVSQTEHTCTANGTHIVEDLNPTRFLYELEGWECDGVIYQVGDEIVLTGDATLAAVWARK